jgi:hypothetical protein
MLRPIQPKAAAAVSWLYCDTAFKAPCVTFSPTREVICDKTEGASGGARPSATKALWSVLGAFAGAIGCAWLLANMSNKSSLGS